MSAEQAGPIAIYGATGYTGRLTAAELVRAGADVVLAGRDPAKLARLAAELGGSVRTHAVALGDAAGLRRLLEPCACVIACAGPFVLHGEPVLAAAAETGTHYVDSTGEQPFMRLVFERYGPVAERNGAVLLTAMGFDYVPGDMIAALTAEGMDEVDELELAYGVEDFGTSRGTARSALGMLGGESWEWRDGRLVPADRRSLRPDFAFPPPLGPQRMVRYPAGEHITVPRHVPVRTVRTSLSAAAVVPGPLRAASGVVVPLTQMLAASPLRSALARAIDLLPEGPSEGARRAARFTIVCEARAGSARRVGVIRGRDVYGLTARSLAVAARRCAAPGFDRTGALAPSEAFPPRDFLPELAEFEVAWEVQSPADASL